MYIDDDETIYIIEISQSRVIALKANVMNFTIVAGGNGDGNDTHQLFLPTVIVVDKKTDTMFIYDQGNNRVVRWSRQNTTNGNIIISNICCNGLAMDDKGYLYVSDWFTCEVRRCDLVIYYSINAVIFTSLIHSITEYKNSILN